jgi:hypothetical protein
MVLGARPDLMQIHPPPSNSLPLKESSRPGEGGLIFSFYLTQLGKERYDG